MRRLSRAVCAFAGLCMFICVASYFGASSNLNELREMAGSVKQQLDDKKTQSHHGPLVLSAHHEKMVDPQIFELLQNASDAFNTKT